MPSSFFFLPSLIFFSAELCSGSVLGQLDFDFWITCGEGAVPESEEVVAFVACLFTGVDCLWKVDGEPVGEPVGEPEGDTGVPDGFGDCWFGGDFDGLGESCCFESCFGSSFEASARLLLPDWTKT